MERALSFPVGRNLFVEDNVLKLTVAKTPLVSGGEAVLEHPIRFCPFCGTVVEKTGRIKRWWNKVLKQSRSGQKRIFQRDARALLQSRGKRP
jgi:hypothetical protein